MKKIFTLILVLSALMSVCSCGGNKNEGPDVTAAIVAEWHLVDVTGVDSSEIPQVYLDFKADKSFELYQKIGEGRYRKYNGTYTVSGNVLSGKYSDGEDWGCSYGVSFAESNLKLAADNGSEEVCTYEKKSLSASDKSNAVVVTKSEESHPRFL
jgi:hypothetical protein